MVDSSLSLSQCSAVSNDAKAIILADSSSVQRPGPYWSRMQVLPEHTWDQSRTNAVTPTIFLIQKPVTGPFPSNQLKSLDIQVSHSTTLQVTRSGQGITLLNLSFLSQIILTNVSMKFCCSIPSLL